MKNLPVKARRVWGVPLPAPSPDGEPTWASWHVQNGTPLFALQELAGWETEKMVRRYAHFAAGHLALYADNLESHGTAAARPSDFCGTRNPTC